MKIWKYLGVVVTIIGVAIGVIGLVSLFESGDDTFVATATFMFISMLTITIGDMIGRIGY